MKLTTTVIHFNYHTHFSKKNKANITVVQSSSVHDHQAFSYYGDGANGMGMGT